MGEAVGSGVPMRSVAATAVARRVSAALCRLPILWPLAREGRTRDMAYLRAVSCPREELNLHQQLRRRMEAIPDRFFAHGCDQSCRAGRGLSAAVALPDTAVPDTAVPDTAVVVQMQGHASPLSCLPPRGPAVNLQRRTSTRTLRAAARTSPSSTCEYRCSMDSDV